MAIGKDKTTKARQIFSTDEQVGTSVAAGALRCSEEVRARGVSSSLSQWRWMMQCVSMPAAGRRPAMVAATCFFVKHVV